MRAAHKFRASYLSLAKFALSLSRPRRWRSEPTIVPSPPQVPIERNPPSDAPSSQPSQPIQDTRAPSPALTEIIEPESETILKELQALNIKVRDFAFPSSSSRPPLPPVAELFDPYRALSEYEYRLRMTPHIPIPGKTLRRLCTLGWVPQDEADARLRAIDWQALQEYDARNTGYPYRTMRWKTVPTAQERDTLFANGVPYFRYLDKVQDELRMEEEWREQERLRGEEAGEIVERRLLEIQERERRKLEESSHALRMALDRQEEEDYSPENGDAVEVLSVDTQSPNPGIVAGKKRALERSPSTPSLAVSASTSAGPKRIKLAVKATYPAPTRGGGGSPPQQSTDAPQPYQYQQYPAPLHAYDPRIYPNAASVIAAEDRSTPVVLVRPPAPGQVTVTPPVSDDESESEYALGGRVKRKRNKNGLKGLVRTKTFAQL